MNFFDNNQQDMMMKNFNNYNLPNNLNQNFINSFPLEGSQNANYQQFLIPEVISYKEKIKNW